jgi:hypothetical protein
MRISATHMHVGLTVEWVHDLTLHLEGRFRRSCHIHICSRLVPCNRRVRDLVFRELLISLLIYFAKDCSVPHTATKQHEDLRGHHHHSTPFYLGCYVQRRGSGFDR